MISWVVLYTKPNKEREVAALAQARGGEEVFLLPTTTRLIESEIDSPIIAEESEEPHRIA